MGKKSLQHILINEKNYKIKKDSYYKKRGGSAVILEIICAECKEIIFTYQKDGPGSLLRLYLDRIISEENYALTNSIICECGNIIGHKFIYKSEKRTAYRLIKGSFMYNKLN